MPFKIEVTGEYACFTRPEFKAERVSYDVMTPSAARGILDSIYWHPGMRWVVDEIRVCNPIRQTTIKRNEVGDKISSNKILSVINNGGNISELGLVTTENRQQRSSLILRDVRYVISAHFELTDSLGENDSEAKFASIITRRLEKGQCFQTPYLGCREFPARFYVCEENPPCPDELKGEKSLGYMLYDIDFDSVDYDPMFFSATLQDGVLTVPPRTSREVIK